MRKVDPDAVRRAFVNDAQELNNFRSRTAQAIQGGPHEQADISRLASTTFLSLYVAFETFLSDLFLAYLNRDFTTYQKWLEGRVFQSVTEKFGTWPAARVSFSPLKHVAVSELEDIVDPTGKNLTFSDAAAIIGRANDWLIPAQRNRIRSLTPSDQDLIDTARAIRNFIAHGSTGSKKIMNDALATVDRHGRNPHLDRGQNKVHDEGAYLKAVFNGHRRIATYTSRFKEIAAKM